MRSCRFVDTSEKKVVEDELRLGACWDIDGALKVEKFEKLCEDVTEALLQRGMEPWIRECREVSQWIQDLCASLDVELMAEGFEVLCHEVKSLREEYMILCVTIREVLVAAQRRNEELNVEVSVLEQVIEHIKLMLKAKCVENSQDVDVAADEQKGW